MKRIVTIQDISCVGKCSLTVALPVLSAMGVETAVIPTAVLSAHSVFPDFTFRDLTEEIPRVAAHWKQQALDFDAIYTGYLGSEEQIQVVSDFFDEFRTPNTAIVVDPAMADQGRMYAGFDRKFAGAMRELCAKADLIDPNVTEACFMTDTPYREQQDEKFIQTLLEKTAKLCSGIVVLTGVSAGPEKTGVVGMDTRTGAVYRYEHPRMEGQFHGTGDIFSSTLVGGLMRGLPPEPALRLAADFTHLCIEKTVSDPERRWYGVSFEQALPELILRLQRELFDDFTKI